MSSALATEIANNCRAFDAQAVSALAAARTALAPAKAHFESSYARIASIQAWRTSVIQEVSCEDAQAFFFEAQNDFLVSHCLARHGSFRQALKALRSAIENVYFSLYYKDHPVELENWLRGQHKLGFTELTAYFEKHPALARGFPGKVPLAVLGTEYSTLSKAVHGSAKAFRMTQNLSDVQLWIGDVTSVGKWASREKAVVSAVNLILLQMFRDKLTGTKLRGLREVLGLVIPAAQAAKIKTSQGITIIPP